MDSLDARSRHQAAIAAGTDPREFPIRFSNSHDGSGVRQSLRGAKRRSNPFFYAARWIASRSLSSGAHSRDPLARNDGSRWERVTCSPHNSLALLNANEDTRRVFSSRISVRVIGGSARWLQFSRSQSRQLTPIGVPSVFSRSIPVA